MLSSLVDEILKHEFACNELNLILSLCRHEETRIILSARIKELQQRMEIIRKLIKES